MTDILKLVLTDHWFEEIKSGRKTHEYRKLTPFWIKRLTPVGKIEFVEFQKAYRKNAEKMTFKINYICLRDGKNTDLEINHLVF